MCATLMPRGGNISCEEKLINPDIRILCGYLIVTLNFTVNVKREIQQLKQVMTDPKIATADISSKLLPKP